MTVDELNIQVLLLGFIQVPIDTSTGVKYWDKGYLQLSLWKNDEYSFCDIDPKLHLAQVYLTQSHNLSTARHRNPNALSTKDPEIVYNIIVNALTEK